MSDQDPDVREQDDRRGTTPNPATISQGVPPITTPADPSPERQMDRDAQREKLPGSDGTMGGEPPSASPGITSESTQKRITEQGGDEELEES